jgi:hypothetical protein
MLQGKSSRRFLMALTLSCSTLILPAVGVAQASAAADSAAVMQTIETMLSALRTKNADGMRATFHESARMTLLRPAQGGGTRVVAMTAEQFITSATNPSGPAIDEPIRNANVQIDGNLATVWAEYQVRIDGKVSHCGHDAFHLVKSETSWKILNVSDTFRQQGCGEMWK